MKTKIIGQCKDCKWWVNKIPVPSGTTNFQFWLCEKENTTPKNGTWGCWNWESLRIFKIRAKVEERKK
jgi:hypothetical protein